MTLYTESVAGQTDHFADVFVRENVEYHFDIVTTFSNFLQPTPYCLEKSSVVNVLAAFSVQNGLE